MGILVSCTSPLILLVLVSNCIGVKNRRYYLLFLTYLSLLCCLALYPLALIADGTSPDANALVKVAGSTAHMMFCQGLMQSLFVIITMA
jgi:hypothetical protein